MDVVVVNPFEPSPIGALETEGISARTDQTLTLPSHIVEISPYENRPLARIKLRETEVFALIDSGASRTFMGPAIGEKLRGYLMETGGSMQVADGQVVGLMGCVQMKFTADEASCVLPVRVTNALTFDFVLGMDFIEKMGIIIDGRKREWRTESGRAQLTGYVLGREREMTPVYAVPVEVHDNTSHNTQSKLPPSIPDPEPSIPPDSPLSSPNSPGVDFEWSGINSIRIAEIPPNEAEELREAMSALIPPKPQTVRITPHIKHHIDVQCHPPIRQGTRRYAPAILQAAHAEVDTMLAEGVIEPSRSPWCSWPVLHKKPNGSYRFCVDYRKVNAVTKHDSVPMQNLEELLDQIRGAVYISKLDLSQAFFHIELEPESREITAFAVPGRGLFQFKRMAFGLRNGPASFQRLTDLIIPPEWSPHVRKYVDDFIIFTNTLEDHVYWVGKVIEKLTEANLTINPEKSEFLCDEVTFLGYKIDQSGLFPDPDRIAPISNYPVPRNVKEIQQFLGAVGWYARFLPTLSEDKIPLLKLVKKGVKWAWGPEQQVAFEKLRNSLTEAPVLARPDFSKRFTLQTDASDYALGAVLTQPGEFGTDVENKTSKMGSEHAICYASRVLTMTERNYTVTEKECLAVLWAVDKFRPYIEGSQFDVITDHSSLRWLKNLKNPTGRLARWAMQLQAHDITVVHR